MLKFKLRWATKDGEQSKIYEDEKTAKKAKQWLLERGIDNVDIAVILPPKPVREPESDDRAKDGH